MRLTKQDPTGTHSYLADGVSPASPLLSDGATAFTPGISETNGTASGFDTRFYLADAQGNSRGLLNAGETNTDGYNWDAFGNSVSQFGSDPTAYAWGEESGYQTDNDSGLKLLGCRYYDSRTGRFISQDPIGDGDNWYAYADNSPMNEDDPTGLYEMDVTVGAGQTGVFYSDQNGNVDPNGNSGDYTQTVTNNTDQAITTSIDTEYNSTQTFNPYTPAGGGDVTGPSMLQDIGSGFMVGGAAVASISINYGLFDGGSYRHDPSFGVSAGLADAGVNIASFATGLGEVGVAGDLAKSGCFTAGTQVQTENGTEPIEDVQAGELVVTRDPQTGRTETRKVVRTFAHPAQETVTAEFADAGTGQVVATVTATPEHPFYVAGRGFAALGSLGVGAQVVTRAGPALVVKSLTRQSGPKEVTVYNLEVEGDWTEPFG